MGGSDDADEKRGFKVQDRRRFSESGEAKPEVGDSPQAPPPNFAIGALPEADDLTISFTTFVLSLSAQALAHLGEIPSPIDGSVAVDLPAAGEMIDILAMLGDKTKGNLDTAEAGLLDSVLYDLRMRYVQLQHASRR